MFSSLASYLFGSKTNCETNRETTATATATESGGSDQRDTDVNSIDEDNFIQVTSLTPSVTGAGDRGKIAIKRGKNKRNNARQQNKRKTTKAPTSAAQQKPPVTPGDNCESEFDEDDWLIVEKEDEKQDLSIPCNDSDVENISEVDIAEVATSVSDVVAINEQQLLQHINSHSLCFGPEPQKHDKRSLRKRSNTKNRSSSGLSISTLSPSRIVDYGHDYEATVDGGITLSLCLAPPSSSDQGEEKVANVINAIEMANKMEESWFVTPPPCFTSTGPINMETSPFENLLIEHPSMSVYRSINLVQETGTETEAEAEAETETFTKLDMEVNDEDIKETAIETTTKKNNEAVEPRSSNTICPYDRQSLAFLKKELIACNVQKLLLQQERKEICRSAIQRANKVRDVQSRNHIRRRSDNQHSKVFSFANNNRKSNCC